MPVEGPHRLFASSKKDYVLLDTNLLILEISARIGPKTLNSFKRINTKFSWQDVSLLVEVLSRFKAARTTSYVLAEASNLANGLSGALRDAWFEQLAQFAMTTEEAHVGTETVGTQTEFWPFGVTDSALSYLAQENTMISSDGRLCSYLERCGRKVINFNHLRPLWMSNHV